MDAIAQPATSAAERTLSAADLSVVLARANELVRAAKHGPLAPVLRGKNIGLVSARPDDADARLLRQAATALGAQVAHVRPSLTSASSAADIADTARMLGLLYDAVDIAGTPADVVRQVAQSAGVPVFDGIGSPHHPLAGLATRLEGGLCAADARRFILQAVLLTAMS
ncbi:ornithine carbamoyltransferase [Aquincola sp. S2]|uniref:Ornithine carbamoyltransferase n=1 Tax=Pseudaquabacterium terrae TaxID=2732868 RepID=A0ABX2ER69_9BURK|nr:ornithine carbamoyltransferase [Aquabacterium terrae]NRF71006.1 ornithine carbamoyltransferase [Aquabacterium terrae]